MNYDETMDKDTFCSGKIADLNFKTTVNDALQ